MKVYVVDDSPLVRERLVSLLSEVAGVEVVGSADNAEEGIAGISMKQPDVGHPGHTDAIGKRHFRPGGDQEERRVSYSHHADELSLPPVSQEVHGRRCGLLL